MSVPPSKSWNSLSSRGAGVVIPAYQAEASLPGVLDGVLGWLPAARVLVVNDGSTDGTPQVAETRKVALLSHPENRGKGSALMTGLLHARTLGWEWAITLDADGQHSMDDLPSFLSASPEATVGLVVGQRRRLGTAMPWHRRFSNSVTTGMISRLAGKPVFDAQCGFRAYRLDLLDHFPREGRFEWESQVLVICGRKGMGLEPLPIRTVYSGQGSHMHLGRDTWRFLRMVGKMAWTTC